MLSKYIKDTEPVWSALSIIQNVPDEYYIILRIDYYSLLTLSVCHVIKCLLVYFYDSLIWQG